MASRLESAKERALCDMVQSKDETESHIGGLPDESTMRS